MIALPGPPHELAAIWQSTLQAKLTSLLNVNRTETIHLKRWVLLGVSESMIAEKVEACLANSGLEIGYRARIPYVDVKVWIPDSKLKDFNNTYETQLTALFGKNLCGTDNFDAANSLLERLSQQGKKQLTLADFATDGALAQRLCPLGHSFGLDIKVITENGNDLVAIAADKFPNVDAIINLLPEGRWQLTTFNPPSSQTFSTRYSDKRHLKRLKAYVTEAVLVELHRQWKSF